MSPTKIANVHGRRIWDSRGRPTVEAEVRLACGAKGRAIAPSGHWTGYNGQPIHNWRSITILASGDQI